MLLSFWSQGPSGGIVGPREFSVLADITEEVKLGLEQSPSGSWPVPLCSTLHKVYH